MKSTHNFQQVGTKKHGYSGGVNETVMSAHWCDGLQNLLVPKPVGAMQKKAHNDEL